MLFYYCYYQHRPIFYFTITQMDIFTITYITYTLLILLQYLKISTRALRVLERLRQNKTFRRRWRKLLY